MHHLLTTARQNWRPPFHHANWHSRSNLPIVSFQNLMLPEPPQWRKGIRLLFNIRTCLVFKPTLYRTMGTIPTNKFDHSLDWQRLWWQNMSWTEWKKGLKPKSARSFYPKSRSIVCLMYCSPWKVDKYNFVRYFSVFFECSTQTIGLEFVTDGFGQDLKRA